MAMYEVSFKLEEGVVANAVEQMVKSVFPYAEDVTIEKVKGS